MPKSVASGLAPVSETLANGVRLLVERTRTTPAVTVSLALQAGTMHDPPDRPGTAHFASRVIDRGTTSRDAGDIAEAFDVRGVTLRAAVSRHLLTLSCDCLTGDFEAILQLLSAMVREASYPEAEVDIRRGEVRTAIRQDQDSPAAVAVERLMGLLYGEAHPYGRPGKGTVESVDAVGAADLRGFHRARVTPAGASLVVVGDLAPETVVDLAARELGSWSVSRNSGAEDPTLPSPVEATSRRRVVIPMMTKSQADVAYGFTTITRTDPAYHAYVLMANVFGQYGMGGRLGRSIRERQGMAYYAFCGFEASVLPGPLVVRAGVSAANVDRAVASIDAEATALAEGGVTEAELADAKRYVIGSLPRTLETNAGIAAFLQTVQQFDLGLDYDQRLPGFIDGVSRSAVDEAARRTLAPARAALVIAGPYEDAGGG